MSPLQFSPFHLSYTSWGYPELVRFIAFSEPEWRTAVSPCLEGRVIELLQEQEAEILTFSQGNEVLCRFPADPSNPLFYFQRERWLEAINKIQFWKHLPGGAEYLKASEGYEESLAPQLAEWMLQRSEVLDLKTLQIFKGPMTRLPPEIGLCNQLVVLMVMHTALQQLPPQLGELAHLKVLFLSCNRLRRLCPEFQKLQSLERLELHYNQLENIDPVGFLRNLKKFYASKNQIHRLPPELHWHQLDSIDLGDNQISELPEYFYDTASLTLMDLSSNRLTGISERIRQLTQLDTLIVSQNQITTLPASLGKIPKLRSIILTHNQVSEIPLSLLEAPSLIEILFNGNRLSERPKFLPARIYTDVSFQG